MKLLVTGCAGFIGSNLTEYLLKNGHTVIGIDNFNSYYDPKIKHYNIKDFKDHPQFILHKIDLLDKKQLSKIYKTHSDIKSVVHLAAWAGVTHSFVEPITYIRNNIEATANLLVAGVNFGIKNIVFASTSSVYGLGQTPFVETMTTDFPLAPYPATKKACEVLLYGYSKNFGINATILRIFNPNGPRIRPDLAMPKLIKSCLYGYEFPIYRTNLSDTKRDYCHVKYVCRAIQVACQRPYSYEIVNLGNSSPVSLQELIDAVQEVTGKKANIVQKPTRAGEMHVTYASINKAKHFLDYNPNITLKEIVSDYYNWFLDQDDWYKRHK